MFRTGAIAVVSTLVGGVASPVGVGLIHANDATRPPSAFAVMAVGAGHHRDGGPVRLRRQPDGLFHVPVTIKGDRYVFIVDTGASVTVLTAADAARLGLSAVGANAAATLRTAGGSSAMHWSAITSMTVAGRTFRHVDVAVVARGPTHSLLGQDVLSGLGVLRIEGDTLEIS